MPLSKTMKLFLPIGSNNTPTVDVPYAKAIGSLMYAALGTQPDIAFTIQHLSQFTTSYGQEHWCEGNTDDEATTKRYPRR